MLYLYDEGMFSQGGASFFFSMFPREVVIGCAKNPSSLVKHPENGPELSNTLNIFGSIVLEEFHGFFVHENPDGVNAFGCSDGDVQTIHG